MNKYIFITDTHYGFEYDTYRHKRPIHDEKAIEAVLAFARDFKPNTIILGGDILDCGPISHHNKNKPGNVEGLRLKRDITECRDMIIKPLEALKAKDYFYIKGNHERWLDDYIIDCPQLEGLIGLDELLTPTWKVIPCGGRIKLGKLSFMHGDTLSGGAEHVAKQAWALHGCSVRFGHRHTYQVHTPKTAIDSGIINTAVAVPCLCRRDPAYNEGKANAWMQGFNYGYIMPNGHFNDYVVIVHDGKFVAEGKLYESPK